MNWANVWSWVTPGIRIATIIPSIPNIMPINEVTNTSDIANICTDGKEPLIITKNGYSDIVIMSVEVYEKLFTVIENKKEKKSDPLKEIDQFIKTL